jgi:CubicO group peptidase (beta-lactamase class C family)
MIIRIATCTVGLLFASAVAAAQREQLDVEKLRTKIQRIVADGTTPSLAVAVARDGRILWSEGFGFADRENQIPATADTPYSIASVTKPFTATAVMILQERQKLALDEPVSRYLGPLNRPGGVGQADITLRQILGHVAGFPVHYQYFFDDQANRPLPFDETIRCYGAEIQKPGSRYSYSNLGYEVLAETITRVSGQRYRDFLAREIFAPLGLKRASVPERAGEAVGAAKRYGRDGSPLPFYVTDFAGGSMLYATVEDLVRFGSFHADAALEGQRAVLSPASLAAMQQPGPGDYGLGWNINRTWMGKHKVVWHSGAMPGSSATLWLVPAEKIVIAVVANQITAPVNRLAGEILAELLPGESATTAQASEQSRPSASSPPTDDVNLIGRYRGVIQSCPKPEAIVLDVRGPRDVVVTFGRSEAKPLANVRLNGGKLAGIFNVPRGAEEDDYRLELRLVGERLTGPVTRRTSLGPRANMMVTLWAELEREP